MRLSIRKADEQKEFYFDLNWFMQRSSGNNKTHGAYVIYKDDICLYVGQSKNMSSRIATHLHGKYAMADRVIVYIDEEYLDVDGTDDEILLESEKYLMNKLQPIENVLVDFSTDIDISKTFSSFQDIEQGAPLSLDSCYMYELKQYGSAKKDVIIREVDHYEY